jgi:class 3 adenylate cyclase/predicted ATPase
MFCDLVGSTALSAHLDPEELREVVHTYQETCTDVIHRYEGRIAQHLGDGLLVYFGYPAAHEDDAQRAVRVGLETLAALPRLNTRLQQTVKALRAVPLQVRIGIHTGLVVIGEVGGGGKREQLALGEAPNIAARLQGLAAPDTVVISATTQRLVQGLFECRELRPQEVKGLETPLAMYCVLGEGAIRSRFEVAVSSGLTPLVGREEEGELLRRRWERAKAGEGQVVLLSGEAGIGKSRLVQELKEQVVREEGTRIEFRCSPYYQNSALYPLIEHMQRLLEFQRGDSSEEKLRKLEGGARLRPGSSAGYIPLQPEAVPLFAALLSLPHPNSYPPLNLSPQKQKQKTQEALVAWLLAEAAMKPALAAWEDLHWADPSTLEVLSLCLDQASTAHLLLLLTFRPDFHPPWAMLSHLTQLTLSRLGRTQVEEMVKRITGGKALPTEAMQQIVSKTDGVPLFVEELTKMVVESGLLREAEGHYELTGPLPPLAIPATLQDSLVARLDRLTTVKEVAQLGATLGREFSYEMLQAISPVDETSLRRALTKLVEAEVLYQRGLPPQARYLFKHALIQDAAYQSLLKSTRQQYHQQIAHVLEKQLPETRDAQPELLAHHYTAAGLIAQAIPYWQQAGQRAAQRSANVEAIAHLTKGLALLKIIPDTLERTQQELRLQIILGAPLMATKGWAAPEVGKAYTRARELCQQVGETSQLFPVLWGLWVFSLVRAELQTARELGEQLLTLAQSAQDPALLLEAHHALWVTLLYRGELLPARAHMEQGIALYDPQQHRALAFLYGSHDPAMCCQSSAAVALWLLGYPEQALESMHDGLTRAQELSHPFSLAWALHLAAELHQLRREGQLSQERAEALIVLSSEQAFTQLVAWGTTLGGWALAEQKEGEEGIVQMRRGLAAWRATGAEWEGPYILALLAEAYGKVGQADEGLSVLAEALAAAHKTGERYYEAELYRLKGMLMLQLFNVQGLQFKIANSQAEAEAEACFHKAIEIARRQEAKSLELRAVMSLSRLWQTQGKQHEAHSMLSEIYGWFTEGFDTKDLQEAKTLLEQLLEGH